MEALLGGVIVVIVGQFSLLWWCMGRIEGWVKKLNGNPGRKEEKKE